MNFDKILARLDNEIMRREAAAQLALATVIVQDNLEAIKELKAARAIVAHVSALAATA